MFFQRCLPDLMVYETLIEARKPILFRLRLRVFCNVLQLGCLQKTRSLMPYYLAAGRKGCEMQGGYSGQAFGRPFRQR